jgi:serine/threonine-protein kinase
MTLATFEQVRAARHTQALALQAGSNLPLLKALIADGVITQEQCNKVMTALAQSGGLRKLGKYTLIKQLGRGAMGVVYLADDALAGRRVALKILLKKIAENPAFISRFRREAKAIGKLNHENVISAFDAGEDQGHHYYVMEYCEGKPLSQILKASKFLPWDRAVDIVTQIASGLKHAHENGILHRDIKPDNIFISSDGIAKILDLGLSKNIEDAGASFHTQSGSTVGTPHYISPEQARGDKAVDGRTDIYSLGATFYHLLTGQLPFDGPTAVTIMLKSITEDIPNPQLVRAEIPDAVVTTLQRMTSRDLDARYRDCDELLVDLNHIKATANSFMVNKPISHEVGAIRSRANILAMRSNFRRSTKGRVATPLSKLYVIAFGGAGILLLGCAFMAVRNTGSRNFAHDESGITLNIVPAVPIKELEVQRPAPEVNMANMPPVAVETARAQPSNEPSSQAIDIERQASIAFDAMEKQLNSQIAADRKISILDNFIKQYPDSLASARARNLKSKLVPSVVKVAASSNETTETLNSILTHARELSDKRNYSDALIEYNKAIQIDPNQGTLYQNRATMRFEMSDYENALADSDKAIALGINQWQTWGLRAALLYGMKRDDEYRAALDKIELLSVPNKAEIKQLIERDGHRVRTILGGKLFESKTPETASEFAARGQARLAQGKVIDGITDLKDALKRDPSLGPKGLFPQVSNVARMSKNYRECLDYLKQWAAVKPSTAEALNAYAWELLTCEDVSLRDAKTALELAEESNRLSGNSDPAILDTLALAYFNNGRVNRALSTETKALSLLPPTVSAQQRKEFEDRIQQFQRATQR